MASATHAPKSRAPERGAEPVQARAAEARTQARRPQAGLGSVGNQTVQRLAMQGLMPARPAPRLGGGPPPPAAPAGPGSDRGQAADPGPPVQAQCAACAAEAQTGPPNPAAPLPVQPKCATCAAEVLSAPAPPPAAGPDLGGAPIQRWDCGEYQEPSCAVSAEDAALPPVQSQCAACADEAPPEPPQAEPVQPKCPACEAKAPAAARPGPGPARIHREARAGLQEATQPLPHAERLQAAFGPHDLSGVRARVGGPAETANRRIGALAFASGERIAFRDTPDLRLAAHEATHVVQQREGLRLPGNLGQAGDPWEHHADRVADAVVAGHSAVPLLDRVATPARRRPTGPGRPGPGAPAQGKAADPGPDQDPVQRQIVGVPPRLFEPAPAVPKAPVPAQAGGGPAGAPGGAAPPPATDQTAKPMDSGAPEVPPPGITVGGGAPGAGAAPGGAQPAAAEAPTPATGEPSTPCYNVDPPPPPDDAPEPTADQVSSKPQAEPQVTFDAWVDEIDHCPPSPPAAQAQAKPAAAAPAKGGPAAAPAAGPGPGPAQAGPAGPPPEAPKAPAHPAAAGGPPAAPGPPASAMDGPIGRAEAGRDAALSDYHGALGALADALSRAQGAPRRLAFAPGAGRDREGQANDRIGAFLARVAARMGEAAVPVREQFPVGLGSTAVRVQTDTQRSMDEQRIGIDDRVRRAQAQAVAGAGRARTLLQADYDRNLKQVEEETDKAIKALDAKHRESVDALDKKETKGLDDVNARFAKARKDHEAKGPEYSDKAIARGQKHAHAYERCKVHPKTHVNYDDDGFWDGCLTVRRAKVQQDTACKTASGYHKGFLRTANKKAYDLKELRKTYRCAVITGAGETGKALDETHAKLISGLKLGRAQAIEGLGVARAKGLAAIQDTLVGTLTALAVQGATQRQAVDDSGYLSQVTAAHLAHAGAAGLTRGTAAALDSMDKALGGLRERLAAGEAPDPAVLARLLPVIEASLAGGLDLLITTMGAGALASQGSVAAAGANALVSLQLIRTGNEALSAQAEGGFAAQMAGLAAGTARVLADIAGRQVEPARQAQTEGVKSLGDLVGSFDGALDKVWAEIDKATGASLKGLDKELGASLAGLDAHIAREAWKAAEKEQPAWKSVVAILLIIIVIIVATVISIVTLGAGAGLFATILVGALVGAVSAGLIQVINNWASGEALGKGVVQAMIMGAIGGAVGGALGYAGGMLAAGAASAGAKVATQLAITMGADLLSEGVTQTIGHFAFGQEFNWQGFVTAAAMSGLSFRAHPAAPHPGGAHPSVPHPEGPHAAAPHGEGPHGAAPHAEAPEVPHPSVPEAEIPKGGLPEPKARPHAGEPGAPHPGEPAAPHPGEPAAPHPGAGAEPHAPAAAPKGAATAAGARGARRAAVAQAALGAGVGLAVEGISSLASREKFDPRRAAMAAASGAAARAARMHQGAVAEPRPEPSTRLGRAEARIEARLQELGGRLAGAKPAAKSAAGLRPATAGMAPRPGEETLPPRPGATEEPPTRPREETPTRPVDEADAARARAAVAPGEPVEGRLPPGTEPPDTHVPAATGQRRDTMGWSGDYSAPKMDAPHREFIRGGVEAMDAMTPKLRGELDRLLGPYPEPSLQRRSDVIATETAQVSEQYVRERDPQRRAELQERMDELYAARGQLDADAEQARPAANANAEQVMNDFRRQLLGSGDYRAAQATAQAFPIDPAATAAIEAHGRTPEQVRQDIANYQRMTGQAPSPADYRMTHTGDPVAHYDITKRVINVGDRPSSGTIFHELAHHIEYVRPEVSAASKSFREARATYVSGRDPQPRLLSELFPESTQFGPRDKALVGGYVSEYTGRIYPDAATEVMTTGLGRFDNSRAMLDLYRQDPEHFFYVLGVIRSGPVGTR